MQVFFADKNELQRAYIRQVKSGGIFVTGDFKHEINDDIFLLLKLPDDIQPLGINGKVCWISPPSSLHYTAGIGIQFGCDSEGMNAKTRIENILGELLNNTQIDSCVF